MLDATQLYLHTCWMLSDCTCTHVRCYAIALAHMFDATQLYLRTCWMLRNCVACVRGHMLDATPQCIMMGWGGVGWGWLRPVNLHTCWMLRNCTCAHAGCYAIILAHMLDAKRLHLHTCSMLRNCTCTHVRCYAIVLAHMVLKHKDRGHSTMHPSVSQYVFMSCWRCSLNSPDPQRFLEELEKLL